jgi:hypothetical protein
LIPSYISGYPTQVNIFGLTFRMRPSTALTNCTMSLGSKPRYDNSTSPSRIIRAGCPSPVSLTKAFHVDLSEGEKSSVYSDGAPLGGVGKDDGEIVVNNFDVAGGRFVPYS